MPKTVEEYLHLPYTFVLRRDIRDNIFVARVEEIPGCSAHGDTEEEALSDLRDNLRVWIEDCLESGDPIPTPTEEVELPSGKWLQRVPRSLHLKLIRLAKNDGVSLNQFITAVLAEAAGDKVARANQEAASPAAAVVYVDPWSIGTQIEQVEWIMLAHSVVHDRRLHHGIHSLLRRIPAKESNLIGRGLKSGDEETHENWSTQQVELASR